MGQTLYKAGNSISSRFVISEIIASDHSFPLSKIIRSHFKSRPSSAAVPHRPSSTEYSSIIMKSLALLALVASSAAALRETVQDAALHARQLLYNESVLTLTSIFSESVNPSLAGQPFAYSPSPSTASHANLV